MGLWDGQRQAAKAGRACLQRAVSTWGIGSPLGPPWGGAVSRLTAGGALGVPQASLSGLPGREWLTGCPGRM